MNRDFTLLIHFFLDHLMPPVLRDSRWFMQPIFRLALSQKHVTIFFDPDPISVHIKS
jgi:hypothetical protein